MWDCSPLQKHFIPAMALVSALVITLHKQDEVFSQHFLAAAISSSKQRKQFNFYNLKYLQCILENKSQHQKSHDTAMCWSQYDVSPK